MVQVIQFEEDNKGSVLIENLVRNSKVRIAQLINKMKTISMDIWDNNHFSVKVNRSESKVQKVTKLLFVKI